MPVTTTVRVAVAEDWAVLRRGITSLLHGPHIVVASCDGISSALGALAERAVDLLVVGEVKDFDLATLAKGLDALESTAAVLLLRDQMTAQGLAAALRSGVRGVLSRAARDEELLDAVDRIAGGDRVVDQRFLPLLYELNTGDDDPRPDSLLTAREMEVLQLLSKGHSNRAIAAALFVGEATVKTHLAHIYAKLEVSDRHRAVGRALEVGLL